VGGKEGDFLFGSSIHIAEGRAELKERGGEGRGRFPPSIGGGVPMKYERKKHRLGKRAFIVGGSRRGGRLR